MPTGSRLPLSYQQGEPPVLAVCMQEIFGKQQTSRMAEERVAVVLELLSPAHRPLQITRDLAPGGRGAYREVQKEMKGRYQKPPGQIIWRGRCLPGVPVKRYNGNSEVSAFGQAGLGTE